MPLRGDLSPLSSEAVLQEEERHTQVRGLQARGKWEHARWVYTVVPSNGGANQIQMRNMQATKKEE
jgi:hypothetical protein